MPGLRRADHQGGAAAAAVGLEQPQVLGRVGLAADGAGVVAVAAGVAAVAAALVVVEPIAGVPVVEPVVDPVPGPRPPPSGSCVSSPMPSASTSGSRTASRSNSVPVPPSIPHGGARHRRRTARRRPGAAGCGPQGRPRPCGRRTRASRRAFIGRCRSSARARHRRSAGSARRPRASSSRRRGPGRRTAIFGASAPASRRALTHGRCSHTVLGRLDRRLAQRELAEADVDARRAVAAGIAVGGRGGVLGPEEGRRVGAGRADGRGRRRAQPRGGGAGRSCTGSCARHLPLGHSAARRCLEQPGRSSSGVRPSSLT